jgi:DNA repair protein RecN (Recombination protein N)
MLDELAVANLGILETARIEPGPGLVVLTGETGAGKTLLLGALRLLLGGTARKDQIGPHGPELTVEGRFVLPGGESVAARRITESKGRAYLDGSMVPSKVLSERLSSSVEIVGQHDALSLTDSAVIRTLIDGVLDASALAVRDDYQNIFSAHQSLLEREARLGGDVRSIEREVEVLDYQADEIEAAGFAPGDDVDLSLRAARLRNGGEIAEALQGALAGLEDDRAGVDLLGEAADHLLRAARLDVSLEPLAAQLGTLVEQASTLGGELRRQAADLDHDAGDLDQVELRLSTLGDLRRKYGESLEAVLTFCESARTRATELRELLDDAAGLSEAILKSAEALADAGTRLTDVRSQAAETIATRATEHLIDLGFSNPVVRFDFAASPPAAHGTDRISLAFASDASLTPVPVGRSASGGELSRLVLSVRLATSADDIPVLAFDEIDAGLGGSTAYAMGSKLAALAENRQVFCVTHLPQVAAFANEHFVVDREGATAQVRLVAGDDRIDEITRMLSGLSDSETGREHAAELLATAGHPV